MDELQAGAAQPRTLKVNETLRLEDPAQLWVIEAGQVALFGIPLAGGGLSGPRKYLFSSGAGEALFGLPVTQEDGRLTVVAVALEETLLRRVLLSQLAATGDGKSDQLERLAAVWLERWNRSMPATPAGGWVDLRQGMASAGALSEFHRDLLGRLQQLHLQESELERSVSWERERSGREASGRAVQELASVLAPRAQPLFQGSDLFVAACLVAGSQGISLRPVVAVEGGAPPINPVELIAQASHVRIREVLLHQGWYKRDCGAVLGFLGEERRPVALLPASSRSHDIVDPATGDRRKLDPRTAAALDPRGYVFCRPFPQRLQGSLDLIQFALRGRARDLLLMLATAAAATLLGMLAPLATAVLVDHAIPHADQPLLLTIGLGLLAAAIGAAVFRLSQGIALLRLQTTVDVATQSAVWDRLLNLPLAFFRGFSTGDLEARVNAIAEIRSRLGGTTLRTLFSSVLLLLNLLLLLYYSPLLALVALGAALFIAAITIATGVWVLRCWRQVLELRGRFQGLMVQLVNGIAKLRVAAAEERAFARWAREYAPLLKLELKQRRIQDVVQVINTAATAASFIVLFAVAARLASGAQQGQALTTGVFLAFAFAFGTFIAAAASVSNLGTDLMVIAILQERARPILTAVPEVSERKAHPGRLEGRVEVEHAVFRYQQDGPVILNDINLRAAAGQFIALVGASGSGKSTLLRLLLGLERPQSGAIYYDGQDLAGLDVYAVRRQVGVVLQNGSINAGSIFDNIAAGTQVTLNDTWEAARAAGFADELSAMPMGLHTVVSEGASNLSGGQRQRLLLARAIVHRPRILLLDEATSALDNQTQAIVSESIAGLRITRLVIAHRLSTIRSADQIYVMDAGRIVEEGSYDELQARQGTFTRLMSRQLAGGTA